MNTRKTLYKKVKGHLNKQGIILRRIQIQLAFAVTICPEQARRFNVISALALKHSGESVVRQLGVKLNHDGPLYEKVQTERKT